jgi:Icc-related predicted phosphoesterase
MKLAHISDWHVDVMGAERILKENSIYDEDVEVLVVTGDMVRNFTNLRHSIREVEAARQRKEWEDMTWVLHGAYPNAEIVAVPGNHDFCDYGIPGIIHSFDKMDVAPEVIEVRGLRITGFRGVPEFSNGLWHGERNDRYFDLLMENMDQSCDLYLFHSPPHGIMDSPYDDYHVGIMRLEEFFINNPWIKTRFCFFGHIHECGGQKVYKNGVVYSNAAGTINYFNI